MAKSILAVDSLAIQRSLTLLEDRYRELREIGQKRFEAWEEEKAALNQKLAQQTTQLEDAQKTLEAQLARINALEADKNTAAREKEELDAERALLAADLKETKEELELTLLQLHQVQEELEHYFLEAQREKQAREKETTFLRSKLDERAALVNQYRESLDQLKRITLNSLQARSSVWPSLRIVAKKNWRLPGGKKPLLLPEAESDRP